MTCAACVRAVERVVGALDGVQQAAVNFATETLSVDYDSPETLERVAAAVEKAGYHVVDMEDARVGSAEQSLRKRLLWSVIFTLPLFIVAMLPMVVTLPEAINLEHVPVWYGLMQFLLCAPVLVINRDIFFHGIVNLFKRTPNMDSLIALGSGASFVYSLYEWARAIFDERHAHYFFETAAMIVTLITLGKFLEARAKGRTTSSLQQLLALAPQTAVVLREGQQVELPAHAVVVGDTMLVKPGMTVAADGMVLAGESAVDESVMSGESLPQDKKTGDSVICGTRNAEGSLTVRVTRVGKDTALAQMVALVEQAVGSKAPMARLADRVSAIFVPVVMLLALLSAAVWLLTGAGVGTALRVGVSVLVIACPCALGLATPTAVTVGMGRAARMGILIKNAEILERLHAVDRIAIDKTGTLTGGRPDVTDVVPAHGWEEATLLALTATAESYSEHPIAAAVTREAKQRQLPPEPVESFQALPGYGLTCKWRELPVVIGNERLMNKHRLMTPAMKADGERLADQGKTPLFVAVNNQPAGVIAVADRVRDTSVAAVEALQGMGLEVYMLTGDNRRTAAHIAQQVGIDTDHVRAAILPDGKGRAITQLRLGGHRVAMVGDGINDALALAQADIGFAVASGSDIAVESADVVLMKNDLRDLKQAILLSNATLRTVKQNLFWAFAYNVLGIPVAMGLLKALFGGPLLDPMLAAAAMSLSSVTVVGNALRLKKVKLERSTSHDNSTQAERP